MYISKTPKKDATQDTSHMIYICSLLCHSARHVRHCTVNRRTRRVSLTPGAVGVVVVAHWIVQKVYWLT